MNCPNAKRRIHFRQPSVPAYAGRAAPSREARCLHLQEHLPGQSGSWWQPGLLLLLAALAICCPGERLGRLVAAHPETVGPAANRFCYFDRADPYYVHTAFPRLTTPQWVGEPGVEAVVVLGIDDMRNAARYERFLRPILDRLKRLDGRAAVSIMTCRAEPNDPVLAKMVAEGVSIEAHTYDHPCPLLRLSSLSAAKATYDRCIELLARVPGGGPVAFRMPCCDSMNSASPRFYAEIFNATTPSGRFLSIDSSVFNLFTDSDPSLPRELVREPSGRARFEKYIPRDRLFVNYVENYPYPFVVGRLCWELPCVVPSDWEAHHLHGSKNPQTVRDWLAAVEAAVIKQGVVAIVFHPHGWIGNDQMVSFIDKVVARYGRRVKFLTYPEVLDRLTRHLLDGVPLRRSDGGDNGVRLLDLNGDRYMDVLVGNSSRGLAKLWDPKAGRWRSCKFPVRLVELVDGRVVGQAVQFGVLRPGSPVSVLVATDTQRGVWHFDGSEWVADPQMLAGLELDGRPVQTTQGGTDQGVRLRDLNLDGICELVVANPGCSAVFQWSEALRRWRRLPYSLPEGTCIVDADGRDAGLRFVDVNGDGHDDVLFSNEQGWSLHLFVSSQRGWSKRAAGEAGAIRLLPPFVKDGRNNGTWLTRGCVWAQNEATQNLPHHTAKIPFERLMKWTQSRQ